MNDKREERECGDCVFFRNEPESDFCALTMERVECYEKACADFENEGYVR